MAGTATNVTAGKPNNAGAVYYAPIGTPVPADSEATLDAAFKDLGFVSQEGVTRSISKSTTTIKEWGNGTVLITEDEKTVTYKFKLSPRSATRPMLETMQWLMTLPLLL